MHPRLDNLKTLKGKNYNPELYSKMIHSEIRSKDLKFQKLQG